MYEVPKVLGTNYDHETLYLCHQYKVKGEKPSNFTVLSIVHITLTCSDSATELVKWITGLLCSSTVK